MSARKLKPQTGTGPEAAALAVSHEELERRAYRIFQERGGQPGRDLEHWLQAERELLAEMRRGAAGRTKA